MGGQRATGGRHHQLATGTCCGIGRSHYSRYRSQAAVQGELPQKFVLPTDYLGQHEFLGELALDGSLNRYLV